MSGLMSVICAAVEATALEVKAKWHWWRLEAADEASLHHTKSLLSIRSRIEQLKQEGY